MTDCDATTERITIGGRTATESEKRNGGFKEKRRTLLAPGGGTVEAPVFRFGAESALAIWTVIVVPERTVHTRG